MKIPDDCSFYQTMDILGVGLINGAWDHRGSVDEFLGFVNFKGKSVLDVGPGNGFFSFEMEKRGANVTAIDLGQNADWDRVPNVKFDHDALKINLRDNVRKVENAFWFAHNLLKSKVKLVYGSVYDVPNIVEPVEVGVMSNILQHFRDPLLAIEQVSKVVTETIIITETIWTDNSEFLDNTGMQLIPRADSVTVNHSWWQVSPALVEEVLKLLGFEFIKCSYHEQLFNGSATDNNKRMVKHFTVTGTREQIDSKFYPPNEPQINFMDGWFHIERNNAHMWKWASQKCTRILLSIPTDYVGSAQLELGMLAVESMLVHIFINEVEVWSGQLNKELQLIKLDKLILNPGDNILKITTDNEPIQPNFNDTRKLNFAVYDPVIAKKTPGFLSKLIGH